MSPLGTNLPIRNVRFHGETWRISGRATAIAKATFMTHLKPERPILLRCEAQFPLNYVC